MNIIEKLLMVPLFIHAWGLAKFGEWILVRTIPNILLTSDIGISSHTGNEVNSYAENKNYKQVAKTIYLSVIMMIIIITALMLIGILQFLIDTRGLFGVIIIPKRISVSGLLNDYSCILDTRITTYLRYRKGKR
ncbi:hypothetical protein IUJ34_21165 [Klebsiella pneumoniae subsp. pneumoniae]|uniref:Uncharacterized protein n=1 Tax=Klebsiella pneumoniae subsp. pneumoniae TaxID=72407 RepID=A0A7S9HEP8_KLEPN|nr:hypothetical protein IUJ34_21165 [Klebsiella pneumoniae subsp. pneumoniae]